MEHSPILTARADPVEPTDSEGPELQSAMARRRNVGVEAAVMRPGCAAVNFDAGLGKPPAGVLIWLSPGGSGA
jgi:hypothetical protein